MLGKGGMNSRPGEERAERVLWRLSGLWGAGVSGRSYLRYQDTGSVLGAAGRDLVTPMRKTISSLALLDFSSEAVGYPLRFLELFAE